MYEIAASIYIIAWATVAVVALQRSANDFAKVIAIVALVLLFIIGTSGDWNRSRPGEGSPPIAAPK